MGEVSYVTLQDLIHQREERADSLRDEILQTASQNRRDLGQLCQSRNSLRAPYQKAWLTTLTQAQPERVNTRGWEAYVKKHVIPWKPVTLPPDEEVDLDLLTHKILHPESLLPAPHQRCVPGFYPPFSEVKAKGTRPRALVWGALIPNTILIRLLWYTRTLSAVASERWRKNRRLRQKEKIERSFGGGSSSSLVDDLDAASEDGHFIGGAFGDVSENNLGTLESEMEISWELNENLDTRLRQASRSKRHRGSRQRGRRSRKSSRRRSSSRRRKSSGRTRASSLPPSPTSRVSASASHVSRRSSSAVPSGRRSKGGKSARKTSTPVKPANGSQQTSDTKSTMSSHSSVSARKPREDSTPDKPEFLYVVGQVRDTIDPNMFMGESYEESVMRQKEYMQGLSTKSWLTSLVPGEEFSSISPWQLSDMLIDRIPRDNPLVVCRTITEIRGMFNHFPCKQTSSTKRKTLDLLNDHSMESGAFYAIMRLLESLHTSPDELIPLLLPLYPVCPEPSRRVIDVYLKRVGLRDPTKCIRHELLTWIGGSGSHARRNTRAKVTLERKSEHFLRQWRTNLETNAKLVEEDIMTERMEAQVTLNIVKALAKYESSVVNVSEDELCLDLAGPPAPGFAKNFTCIDVLNYFVEMCDAPSEEQLTFVDDGRALGTREYLLWKRYNKQLAVAPKSGLSLRGDAPLSCGVQLPTSLVTHDMQGGLSPVEWPVLTVHVRVRLANKYLFHQQGKHDGDSATLGAVVPQPRIFNT